MSHILLLEDDAVLAKEISEFLSKQEYTCDCLYDGGLVMKQMKLDKYDMVILDINVPGKNGLDVCKEVRLSNDKIALLMLTAFGEVDDKVQAFNNGADDYLVKPFHFDELSARIKALLRRKEKPVVQSSKTEIGDLVIDHDNMAVYRNDIAINLSPKEYKLLSILAKANGRVLSKSQIAEELWDYHIETNHNSIEVYINFLRKKIETDSHKKYIHTKVGYGYFLKEE
jgi:DNA-binding response OmpR family regulator